jgi:hypothetical protein
MREDALISAIEEAPVSVRSLAAEAGISEKLLRLIKAGERAATVRTIEAVTGALERLGDRHHAAARILQSTLEREEDHE